MKQYEMSQPSSSNETAEWGKREFQSIEEVLAEMQEIIDTLQTEVEDLKTRVAALEGV